MDLSFNHLSGTLSPDWVRWHNLTRLRISNNNITGVIPTEFGQLTKLQDLDLSSNYLQGEIPKSFGSLTLLYNLSLGNNQLVGHVPPEFGMLSNLELLDLSSNNLAGRIPDQLGKCTKLRSLKLNNNNFSGTIPLAIGNLVYLQVTFDISQNSLTGEIPFQLSKSMYPTMNWTALFLIAQLSEEPRQSGLPITMICVELFKDCLHVFHPVLPTTDDRSKRHKIVIGAIITPTTNNRRPKQALPVARVADEVIAVLTAALSCANNSPESRPAMKQVYENICSVKTPQGCGSLDALRLSDLMNADI
nr:PREDICTED: putative leucine-rich repeat receptor-like serine/threonine-protein kinase At2g24130 [Musa acuminata subsp. malaccensis]